MAVHFQLPDKTNYSTKYLQCRRSQSPHPSALRENGATTSKLKDVLESIKRYICKSKSAQQHRTSWTPHHSVSTNYSVVNDMQLPPLTRIDARQDSLVRQDEVTSRRQWEEEEEEEEGYGWETVLEWMRREGVDVAEYEMEA